MGLLFGKMSEKQTIMDVNLKTIAAATILCSSSCYITFCFVNRIDHVVPYQSFYTTVKIVVITMNLGGRGNLRKFVISLLEQFHTNQLV